MKAFQLARFGDAPILTDIACPNRGRARSGVRIAACGLNFADLLMLTGAYQDTPALALHHGMEVSGVVEALGPGVGTPAIGTRVAVFSGQGGLAEAGVFDSARAVPIPDAMSHEQAAGFLVAYGTSHLALTHRARLAPGERLVVLGAAGGCRP